MRRLKLVLLMLTVFFNLYSQSGPGAILPSEKEIPGWRTTGKPKIFNRENLDNLLPVDADLFMEFGLRSAVSMDYYSFSGKVINIQVYTMENTFGSYGIFLMKSKGEKVFREFGNTCFEKAKNFVFWKQYYLVMMKSEYSGDTISGGFKLMAGIIDSKIKSKGLFPDIIRLSDNKAGNITIFKGPLAMSGIYYFGPLNVFYINEGIAIENGDNMEIILKYSDNSEAVRRFSDAAGILSAMSKFSGFVMAGDYSFEMKDKEGKTLTFSVFDNCLKIKIK